MKLPHLIVLVGPTAVGKTSISVDLAEELETHIISADSRQMYKEMRIGTAKPTREEMRSVPHHLVDCISIHDDYSAGQFESDALALITGELRNEKYIVVSGGSGLYIKALLNGLDNVPKDETIRTKLMHRIKTEGLSSLLRELKSKDLVSYERIDHDNPQRVVRALEVCLTSGRPYSSFLEDKRRDRPFTCTLIGLRRGKEELRARIAVRTDSMMADGWIDEAKKLIGDKALNALQTVGYKEVFEHLEGSIDMDKCIELIVLRTSQFAKRQMTWFKKMEDITWFDLQSEKITHQIIEHLKSSVHR